MEMKYWILAKTEIWILAKTEIYIQVIILPCKNMSDF